MSAFQESEIERREHLSRTTNSTEKQESRQVRTKTWVVKSSPQTIHLELVPLVAMDVWIGVESFLFERPCLSMIKLSCRVRHSSEVGFALSNQLPWVRIWLLEESKPSCQGSSLNKRRHIKSWNCHIWANHTQSIFVFELSFWSNHIQKSSIKRSSSQRNPTNSEPSVLIV